MLSDEQAGSGPITVRGTTFLSDILREWAPSDSRVLLLDRHYVFGTMVPGSGSIELATLQRSFYTYYFPARYVSNNGGYALPL